MPTPDARFYDLLEFVLDGSCTDDQREAFSRLVEEHPEWTRRLAEDVFIHSLLQWHSQDVDDELTAFRLPSDGNEAAPNATEAGGSAPRPAPSPPAVRRWLWAAAAATVLVALLVAWQVIPSARMQRRAIAEIVDQNGVAWSEGSTALERGRFVTAGRLETTAGKFTMKFRSGPIVTIEGAASMMIESDRLVHLDRGQATARVPDASLGFTIRTPVINVIDQGTEFGVAARANGTTDVVVFDGKVDLEDSIGTAGTPQRLNRGEAARVDRQGAIERIMQVGRDQAGGWWTADFPASAANVIARVRDNIPPSDGSKYFCYQINFRGLRDDAFAYADDPHQWNGMTTRGLPDLLRGADYVKTFNDYRYKNDFEMVVELSRSANLYVFFDDRVPPPAWLDEQFEDTGIDIGLDEGPWAPWDQARRPDLPIYRNGVGGGKSIDNVFSVWKRRCERAESVKLGLMGEEVQARAMYGIAATPFE